MNSIKNILEQFNNLWNQLSGPARVAVVGTAILSVALIIGVGIWSSRPQYVPLANNLNPADAAEIVSTLNAQGIDNELNFSGSAVMVPKTQWNRARLVVGDIAAAVPAGSDDFEESFLSDPAMNRFKILRHREQVLARSIMRIDSVVTATVHIGVGEPSPFVREREPTTASVVIELQSGAPFTRENAAAVVAMVSGSVEGLLPENVTVMDTRGRILSTNGYASDTEITNQFEFRRKLETDLSSKAELMLGEMLGDGRAVVRVTADIDFTRTERTETAFDPDGKVKKSERIKSVARSRSTGGGLGPAGTSSNLTAAAAGQTADPVSEKEEENETEYENAKTVDTVKEVGGTINRLTIAAMVDLESETEDGGQRNLTAEQVESIIKQAVGFDAARNDEIEVLVTALAGVDSSSGPDLDESEKWQFYSKVARQSSLGLAAVVALVLGVLILKRMRPVTIPGGDDATQSAERARALAELSERARENPEALAHVVAAWLGESTQAAGQLKAEGDQLEYQERARAA